jgi:D-alanyl-D-alanine carboxypeptidase
MNTRLQDHNRIVHKVPASHRRFMFRPLACAATLATALMLAATAARSEALIVADAESGRVLYQENATYPWYPASTTKLMTMYVALKAVKEGRIQLDTLLTVSPVAASQAPTKMGFKAGTTVTLENALAMMMVKSANDLRTR